MMKRILLLAVLAAVAACSSPPPPPSINEPPQIAAVDAALRAYDAVLTKGDTLTLRSLVAPGFKMHEDNAELDIDSAADSIDSVSAAGTMERQLRDVAIEQRGPVAWVNYKVHVIWTAGNDTTTFERLESMVLEKRDERWLVAFATSMALQ
jgi:hypothetical protein